MCLHTRMPQQNTTLETFSVLLIVSISYVCISFCWSSDLRDWWTIFRWQQPSRFVPPLAWRIALASASFAKWKKLLIFNYPHANNKKLIVPGTTSHVDDIKQKTKLLRCIVSATNNALIPVDVSLSCSVLSALFAFVTVHLSPTPDICSLWHFPPENSHRWQLPSG